MAIHIQRRKFITLLSGAVASRPLAVRAQQATRPETIGFMGSTTALVATQWTAAFMQRLRELGWTEGRNLAIEFRWAEGKSTQSTEDRAPVGLSRNTFVCETR